MINEKQLVNNYSSFWKSILPLQNIFQRKVNLDNKNTNDGFLKSDIVGRRRSYISQVSFWTYIYAINNNLNISNNKFDKDTENQIEELCSKQFDFYNKTIKDINKQLTKSEWDEIYELSKRLYKFFNDKYIKSEDIIFNPKFKGCGFLDDCCGDILIDGCLYEIKMVNRNFRVIDFQQILTYCSLNNLSKEYKIDRICMFNPRAGKYFVCDLNSFCIMISGKDKSILLHEIIDFFTGGGISK